MAGIRGPVSSGSHGQHGMGRPCLRWRAVRLGSRRVPKRGGDRGDHDADESFEEALRAPPGHRHRGGRSRPRRFPLPGRARVRHRLRGPARIGARCRRDRSDARQEGGLPSRSPPGRCCGRGRGDVSPQPFRSAEVVGQLLHEVVRRGAPARRGAGTRAGRPFRASPVAGRGRRGGRVLRLPGGRHSPWDRAIS